MSSKNRLVALLALGSAVLFTAAACTPGVPAPQISTSPVSGTSTTTASGGSITTHLACVEAGTVVTAHVTRLDTGPEFNDEWTLQIRHATSTDPQEGGFPWQVVADLDGDVVDTLVSAPIAEATCLQIWVQAPGYFDLRSPRFNYTLEW